MPTDSATMVKNWQSGMSTGAQKFRDKINAVQQHPGQAAAAQQGLMLQRITDAITSGRWARNVSSYDLTQWKTVTSGVGASNFVNGAQKGLAKYQRAATALAPRLNELSAQISAMPKGGAANAKARSAATIDFMMGLKGIGKS